MMKMGDLKKNQLRRQEFFRNEFAQMDQAVLQASSLQESMQLDIQQALDLTRMDLNDTMFTELAKRRMNADADVAELDKKLTKIDADIVEKRQGAETRLKGVANHLDNTVDDIEDFRINTNEKTNDEHNRLRDEQSKIAEKTGSLVHDVSQRVKGNLKSFRNSVGDAIDQARERLDGMDEQVAGLEDKAQR